MSGAGTVRPTVTALTAEQIEWVHRYSLRILAEIGVRVDSARARQLFARAAGRAAVDGDRVRLPTDLVEWALEAAPHSVALYDRSGNLAFRLPGPSRFGMGVTALYYQDPQTDAVTPFSRQNMAEVVRLGHNLAGYDALTTIGIVQDVPVHQSDLFAVLEMVANTTKPLVILVSEEEAFPAVLDLLEHFRGDLQSRPFVVPYFNPISPLVINQGTVDKMWAAAERGLPFIYSNYGMAGASTPITPAGMLTLMNAELLAGLTLGQLIRAGTPMILGSLPSYFDMKGKGSFYSPPSYALDLACAEMMDHYGLPHAGTSGSGPGWGPDLVAAGHQWMNHLLSCMGKVGLVPFVGDVLGSLAYCPALAVYADDVIGQARMLAQGFALDQEAVAIDEMAEAGPGGNFLTSGQTLRRFRRATYRSNVLPNLVLDEWQERGCPRAEQELRRHTVRLMTEASAPADRQEIIDRGEAYIAGLPALRP